MLWSPPTAGNGASFLFPLAPAEVGYLNAHRPFSLGDGNGSECPIPAIAQVEPNSATGGRFSCNEIAGGAGGPPVFPLPLASAEETSFLASPEEMRAALEAGGVSVIEQADLTATRLGETGRQPVVECGDLHLRLHNLQGCLADGSLLAQFILAEKRASAALAKHSATPALQDIGCEAA